MWAEAGVSCAFISGFRARRRLVDRDSGSGATARIMSPADCDAGGYRRAEHIRHAEFPAART
jgi:hypothetical protein